MRSTTQRPRWTRVTPTASFVEPVKTTPAVWKRNEYPQVSSLSGKFSTFPAASLSTWHDKTIFSHCVGPSGSGVIFVQQKDHSRVTVQAATGGTSTTSAPYHTVVPSYHSASALVANPNLTQVPAAESWTADHWSSVVGDRVDGDKFFCAVHDYNPDPFGPKISATKIVVSTAGGSPTVLSERVVAGNLQWFQGMMGFGNVIPPEPRDSSLLAAKINRLHLFDIGRGSIEIGSRMKIPNIRDYQSSLTTALLLEPKVALVCSSRSEIFLADMRKESAEVELAQDFLTAGGRASFRFNNTSVMASCRPFFSISATQADLFNPAADASPRSSPLSFSAIQGGVHGETWGVRCPETSRISSLFAWHPADHKLVTVVSNPDSGGRRTTSLVVSHARRHATMAILPGSSIAIQAPNTTDRHVRGENFVFGPSEVCGLPGILAISTKTSVASFAI